MANINRKFHAADYDYSSDWPASSYIPTMKIAPKPKNLGVVQYHMPARQAQPGKTPQSRYRPACLLADILVIQYAKFGGVPGAFFAGVGNSNIYSLKLVAGSLSQNYSADALWDAIDAAKSGKQIVF